MTGSVCLTFHFDAVSLWPGCFNLTTPAPVSRGEFAARVGVPRILKLLRRKGIRATFFIPGVTIDTYPDICKQIVEDGHEIANHGYHHISPVPMSEAEEREQFERSLGAMERHLGVRSYGYCSPASDLSSNGIRLLLEYGFKYDATMSADDFTPYWCRQGDVVTAQGEITFGPEVPLAELPFSWTLDDFPQLEYVWGIQEGLSDPEKAQRMWLADLDFMAEEVPNGIYTMCFHPEFIGRGARIRIVEAMIARGRHHGAEFKTCSEAVATWKSANPFPG